ncbi:peptidoglycan-binding protein [Bradyrhizobium sp. ISRA443]|uniref:peptidoglycan-binding domain-containing protein n=1 Tax=unclassified Bradyrhizobium TaxID=2631580 RepID=UPI002478F352|nr:MULTISPECIES: peptidoglycan-binding domain-containing protein [unclassified Bradyrhizobium]WGS01583.1 peptidoglycan-binding protein [Bradyrhizobium sp. ISRA436]WGS08470.1 peptidoglycan-binding protein [Bradyrhizobium sp. ISRA437]WGS15358.1 peptidoglycan-binding protein [Bradyrhizobium sp. ISRA443]
MPRKTLDDDEAPRRRRGAKVMAIEAEEERGLFLRVLLYSPKDMVVGVLAAAVIVAILINALFLQAGRHPSPMFGGSVVTLPPPVPVVAVTSPLPRPRPAEAAARSVEPAAVETPRPVEVKPVETKPAETRAAEVKSAEAKPAEAKASDPMTNLVMKSTAAPPAAAPSNVIRPPTPIPTPHLSPAGRRIAAVQRALTEYGYGQLKPTGTIGADTQTAIAKFERARKIPVTGQMSDRLVHELTAMIGHPIE